MHAFLSLLLAVGLCGLTGCAKDPSKEAPKATVGAVKEGPTKQEGSNNTSRQSVSLDGRVGFVGSKVTASHDGLFKDWKGTASLGKTLEDSSVSFTVQVASVVSDPGDRGALSAKLDGHLKGGDFFDVANHPTAGFASTKIAKSRTAGGSHSITGDLTIRGVTRSVTFPATLEKTKTSLKAKAQFTINRKDWGIMYAGMADDLIRDGVVLKFDLQGTLTP